MLRKIVLIVITLAAVAYYKKEALYKRQHTQLLKQLKTELKNSPNKTQAVVFAVDLHDVLVKPHVPEIISLIWAQPAESFLVLFDPRFWYDVIAHGHIQEKLINHIDKNYKDKGISKQFLIETINTQILHTPVIEFFTKLKQEGYKIYLASNIWPELYDDLLKKLPELQNLFDGHYIPSQNNNYAEKPSPAYFFGLKKYIDQQEQSPKQIIFIDDTNQNIWQATKAGLISFIFTDAHTLKRELNRLGLLN